jgi:asparagine synthase (glutamine-hydrolysing)
VEHLVQPSTLSESLGAYVTAVEDLRMGMGYPIHSIAGRVAEDARVVLSGTGGDEFHGGYVGRYQVLGLTGAPVLSQSRLGRLAARARAPFRGGSRGAYRELLNFLVPERDAPKAFTESFLAHTAQFDSAGIVADAIAACPSDDWRDRVQYVDATTYLVGLLVLEDKLSMAHSLETRVPLLDNELVDFMLDVPHDALFAGATGKVLFRESVRPWVPDEIFAKPKMGFGPPDASWYRGPLRPWIEHRLAPPRVKARGVLRPDFVQRALHDHFSGRRDTTYLIWSFLNFDAWCDEFGFFG